MALFLHLEKMITDYIHYIGQNDYNLDLFESQYPVPCGIAYNSYVILDDKIAIIDTVDARKGEDWKTTLRIALNGRQPDYLLVQHMEPDHSAIIQWVVEEYPSLTVVASQRTIQMLPQFFNGICIEGRTLSVKEGDTLNLGNHTLQFIMAPMVHWPEVMVSYEQTEKVLFSADAFGTFGTLDQQKTDWADEARRYYFNICGKYGVPVQTLLNKVSALDIKVVCPLHGPLLKDESLTKALHLYNIWSKYETEKDGVLVCYASIYGGTAAVAELLGSMLEQQGVNVCIRDLTRTDVSFVVKDAFAYGKVVFAASSYDASVFPPMHNLLHHLQIKAWQKKQVAIIENGSWAPCAGRVMKEMLVEMKDIEILEPIITIRSRMKQTDIVALETLVKALTS